MTSSLGTVLLRLLIAAPLCRWLVRRDGTSLKKNKSKPISKRFFLNIAVLVSATALTYPFASKELNFFEHFNTAVSADKSTVYQQYRRAQAWLDQQASEGNLPQDEVDRLKEKNEMMFGNIHDPSRRLLYIKFGDFIDYSKEFDEPTFLQITVFSGTFAVWVMSIVLLVCPFLPSGALLAILCLLGGLFALEMESRFIEADTLFEYVFIVEQRDWTVFEVITALREALVGVVCAVVIIAGVFGEESGDSTKTHARNLLRTNAGIVTVLKDESLQDFKIEPDEIPTSKSVNIASFISRSIGLLALVSSVFFKTE